MRTHALRWLAAGILAYLVLFPTLIRGHTPASKSAEPTAPSPRWITHGRSPGGEQSAPLKSRTGAPGDPPGCGVASSPEW